MRVFASRPESLPGRASRRVDAAVGMACVRCRPAAGEDGERWRAATRGPGWPAPALLAVMLSVAVVLPGSGQTATVDRAVWPVPAMDRLEAIAASEYASRRDALMRELGEGVLLALGAPAPAADYLPFTQDSRFRWLTGITEPSAALLAIHGPEGREDILFVQSKDPSRELWEGSRLGREGARRLTGMRTETIDRLVPVLDSLLANRRTLFTLGPVPDSVAPDANLGFDAQFLTRLRARRADLLFEDAVPQLTRQRARKSPAELDRIRRAGYISAIAHREAMRAAAEDIAEFEIQALVEYIFLRNGADGPAYASIVGSGPNSTTLHYNASERFVGTGEVLLMDVGAKYDGYSADVTRTVPLDGTFSEEQRAIYEIVLAAQKAAEAALRPGATWRELNEAASGEIARGLARLGLIDAPDATYQCGSSANARCSQARIFYMHGLGHGVGLDVHDPDVSTFDGFQPGSAVTIEPGIYVRADAFDYIPDTPENRAMAERLGAALGRYRDIGVRIEDVFVVDENGVERVSRGAPREIEEIEALMREADPTRETRRPDLVNWKRELRRVEVSGR